MTAEHFGGRRGAGGPGCRPLEEQALPATWDRAAPRPQGAPDAGALAASATLASPGGADTLLKPGRLMVLPVGRHPAPPHPSLPEGGCDPIWCTGEATFLRGKPFLLRSRSPS